MRFHPVPGSVAADNLAFSATGCVPLKPSVFFQGVGTQLGGAGFAYGDGLLCAGGSLIRLETVVVDAAGTSQSSVDIAQEGLVSAGQTRYYQLIYRDPTVGPCGSGFNWTNGIEVFWGP